jgi:hypothetical protein
MSERLAWQLLSEPPKPAHVSFINPAPKPRPPVKSTPQEPPGPTITPADILPVIPKPLPAPAWDDIVGQAALLQRTSELAAEKQKADLKRRGMYMTEATKPLTFDESLKQVMEGRWVNLEVLLAEKEAAYRAKQPRGNWLGTCGDDYAE